LTAGGGSRRAVVVAAAAAGTAALAHSAPALLSAWPASALRCAPFTGRGDQRRVALTFDDGPNPDSTPRFVETLSRYGVRATFFLLGCLAVRAPELCRSIVAGGHEIAIHGWTHRNLLLRGPRATYADLARTRVLLAGLTGQVPRFFRPPYGVLTTPALLACRHLGLTPVRWTCWGRDWTPSTTPASVLETVRPGLTGGATVLLHDSDGGEAPDAWKSTLDALPELLDECDRRGLRVGPLREHGLTSRS
jgi:peptidoglycan/xylan/chitin deacetylase (PgdA/CDA1 family)